jgi:hypothetical protein
MSMPSASGTAGTSGRGGSRDGAEEGRQQDFTVGAAHDGGNRDEAEDGSSEAARGERRRVQGVELHGVESIGEARSDESDEELEHWEFLTEEDGEEGWEHAPAAGDGPYALSNLIYWAFKYMITYDAMHTIFGSIKDSVLNTLVGKRITEAMLSHDLTANPARRSTFRNSPWLATDEDIAAMQQAIGVSVAVRILYNLL